MGGLRRYNQGVTLEDFQNNPDLRKRPPDVPRNSRSRSGPNSTRRNPLVSTRDPVLSPFGLQRTSENPENSSLQGSLSGFPARNGPLGAPPGLGPAAAARSWPRHSAGPAPAAPSNGPRGAGRQMGLLGDPTRKIFRKFPRSVWSYYGQSWTSETPSNILECVFSGHGKSRELERIEMEKGENGTKLGKKETVPPPAC